METGRQYKIALILYTQGLDYDDRIRKEILSIQKIYDNVFFKIFAVEPRNRNEDGVTSYGIPYHIPYLKSREKYQSASHALLKALEFYRSIKTELNNFDAIWCADVETFLFVLLSNRKPVLWDHHELPELFIKKRYMRVLYKFMERKCKIIIHANQPRLDYLNQIGLVSDINKHFVLRNYPEFNEIDLEHDEIYHRFDEWLGESRCVYLQGLMGAKRADVESIGAVLAVPNLKAVVVGRISEERMSFFETVFSKEQLKERIFFAGQQKQLKTPQYIRKCVASLIFYKNTNINNWLCEPNRLFQNLNNGNPVVVGNNPPMKELVDKYAIGVCADTDGGEQEVIVESINEVLSRQDEFKKNIEVNKERWLWSAQDDILYKIIEKMFT